MKSVDISDSAILESLIASDRLGQKTKAGFKKNEDRSIHSVDLKLVNIVQWDRYDLTASESQKTGNDYRIKLPPYAGDDRGSKLLEITAKMLIYSANRVPEISDDILNIDNAMKWGFTEAGPFETWDMLELKKLSIE